MVHKEKETLKGGVWFTREGDPKEWYMVHKRRSP
jgi:hypothetical protein